MDLERGSQRCPSKCDLGVKFNWDLGNLVPLASQKSDVKLAAARFENVTRLVFSTLKKISDERCRPISGVPCFGMKEKAMIFFSPVS